VRRVGRILFLFAAAVSLVLCVAAAGAWVRSGWQGSAVTRGVLGSTVGVSRGEFFLFAARFQRLHRYADFVEPPYGRRSTTVSTTRPTYADPTAVAAALFPGARPPVAGFFFGRLVGVRQSRTMLLLPMWFVIAATAVLPLSAGVSIVHRRRHKRRLSAGCCPACGYDCRATPGRCCECGRGFAAQNAAGG
jgi:hypothetical protein